MKHDFLTKLAFRLQRTFPRLCRVYFSSYILKMIIYEYNVFDTILEWFFSRPTIVPAFVSFFSSLYYLMFAEITGNNEIIVFGIYCCVVLFIVLSWTFSQRAPSGVYTIRYERIYHQRKKLKIDTNKYLFFE